MVTLSAVSPNNLSQLSSGDASDSICPKGWGMAKESGDESYYKLIKTIYGGIGKTQKLDIDKLTVYGKYIQPSELVVQQTMYFIRSGNYDNEIGQIKYRNSRGVFWTSAYFGGARNLNFYETYVFLQYSSTKGFGSSVRCVAKSYFISFVGALLGTLDLDFLDSFPAPPNFLPVMLLTLSAPKGGEWQKKAKTGVIMN